MHSLALPIRARWQMLVVFWGLASAERMDLKNEKENAYLWVILLHLLLDYIRF